MTSQFPPSEIELMRELDRIRDETLDLESLCRRLSDTLQERMGPTEVHIMVCDRETGALENPVPDRAVSNEVQSLLSKGNQEEWRQSLHDDLLSGHPLRLRDRLLGVLVVRLLSEDRGAAERLTQAARSVVDSALEHALTVVDLEERNRELEAIFELDRLRDQHLSFDEMIDRVAQKLLDFINADGSAVVLFNEATDAVDVRFPSGRDLNDLQDPDGLKSLRDLAFRSFKLRDLVSAERLHPSIGSALCVPLILQNSIIGAFLVISREPQAFTGFQRRLLSAMASQIDTAIFEDQQRQRIKTVFKRYVSNQVVEEMLRSGKDFLEGQRRNLTVLFSDIRGFTSTSERLDTDVVVDMLNEHLNAMTEVVLRNHGTLDKFIGDCVMAFWGAPVDQPEHPWMAVKTAIEMRAAHDQVCKAWEKRGLEPIHIGIGINTGEMFVGNIGSQLQSSYTVIGDHVNLASRLEGVAQGRQILITDRTLESIRDRVQVEALEPVKVKGKAEAIPIYNVIGFS
jgi:class 3 adenylate cyclase